MRAAANSQNIANAGTAGYRPVRVSFEAALAEAAGQGLSAIANVQADVAVDPAFQPGDALRLDLEMAEAASTAGRYGALVELLNRQTQITALAVSGGR
ncbi:MAG TPA: hypothetical protein VN018_09970 [Brevundimonas sp.]|nr:hypothetical protein [Brevundimonas sp.]